MDKPLGIGPEDFYCYYCEEPFITATRLLYNYADRKYLPLCEECFLEEINQKNFILMHPN